METLKSASRYGKASLVAAFITFAIFFVMQMLVAEKNVVALEERATREIIIERFERPEQVVNNPIERPDVIKAPPPPDPVPTNPNSGDNGPTIIFDDPITPKETTISLGNNSVWARVKPTPTYPIRARQDNVEGFVILEFTVNEKGKVVDITVLEESPKSYGFAQSAIRAAQNFKYQARMIDGKAVATTSIREKFEYSLEDDG